MRGVKVCRALTPSSPRRGGCSHATAWRQTRTSGIAAEANISQGLICHYFPTREEAEEDAHSVPTEAERRKNRKAWLIFLIGCVLLAVLLLISQPTH